VVSKYCNQMDFSWYAKVQMLQGLGDDNRVGQPPGLADLQYEASIEVNLQMVLNHLPRDPEHLRWLSGKHVNIILEECDERGFLFIS
jgi:hypothetical protein